MPDATVLGAGAGAGQGRAVGQGRCKSIIR